MESAYGIGIANRYALFLDNEDDASSADPYALLATAADAGGLGKHAAAGPHHAPATAAGGKAPGQGPKGPGAAAGAGKPGQKPGDAGALSESKANVTANQKDAGEFLFLFSCLYFLSCALVCLCPLEIEVLFANFHQT